MKRGKNKRRAAQLASFVMTAALLAQTAFAAPSVIDVNVDNIAGYARSGNITIIKNNSTLDDLADAARDAKKTRSNINAMVSALEADTASLMASKAGIVTSDPTGKLPQELLDSNGVLLELIDSAAAANASTISSLKSTVSQLNSVEDSYDQNRFTIINGNEQIAYASVTMLMAYYDLDAQCTEIHINKGVLDRKVAMMDKMYELGLVSRDELDTIHQSVNDLKNGIDALDNALVSLSGQIAVFIGRDPGSINIQPFEGIAGNAVADERYALENSYDLAAALNKSYTVNIAESNPALNGGGTAYDNAELAVDDAKRQFKNAYESIFADANNKLDAAANAYGAYDLKLKAFQTAELRHSLGMISDMEYADAQAQLELDGLALKSALRSYKKAEMQFNAMNEGLWIQS